MVNPLNLFRCMVDFFRLDRWVKRFQKQSEIAQVELWIGDQIILTHNGEPYAHLYMKSAVRDAYGTRVELYDIFDPTTGGVRRG